MSDQIADILSEVQAQQLKYEMVIEPPAPVEQIATLREAVRAELGVDLPDGYAKFLAYSNGLLFDGTEFYATERRAEVPDRPFLDGVVPANLDIRDHAPYSQFLVLGQSGMDLYVQHLASSAFRIIDRVSLDTYESYSSFDELFAAVMRTRL